MARRLIFLLPILMLTLSGCFRQASEPVGRLEGSTAVVPQAVPSTPTDLPLDVVPDDSIEQPELDDEDDPGFEIAVTESTPIPPPTDIVPPTQEPVIIDLPDPDDETEQDAPGIVEPEQADPTQTPLPGAADPVPTDVPIPTPQILTPSAPGSGGIIVVTSPTPEATNPPTPTGPPTTAPENCVYMVQPGDNLFRIAINNNTTVDALRRANPNIPPNNVIQPGARLILPDCSAPESAAPPPDSPVGPSGTVTHVVQSGETLLIIARRYGVTITDIVNANQLANPDRLSIGQELIIPGQ